MREGKVKAWWQLPAGVTNNTPQELRSIRPNRISDVTNPAGIILFQDAFEYMLDANGDTLNDLSQYDEFQRDPNTDGRDGADNSPYVDWKREYFRHGNGCVTLWGDGHNATMGKPLLNPSLPWYTGLNAIGTTLP